jgi:cellulose synthase/poly-beta-1,6-N-acetylglucosamine synthase-like glycosyltransferase
MGSGNSLDDQASAGVLARLHGDNLELRSHLKHLLNSQANLDQRLQRVEDSVIFRFLRWLGGRLAAVGLPVDQSGIPRMKRGRVATDRSYTNWVQESSLLHHVRESDQSRRLAPSSSPSDCGRITFILQVKQADRDRLRRALASLLSQEYSEWDLLVCIDTEPPEWFDTLLAEIRKGRSVEIVVGDRLRTSVDSALMRCHTEFVALVDAYAILEPDALTSWKDAAGPDTIAVYSDWDYIDANGRRHTPRFTPEFSPELLSQTLYWGRCYLARTAQIRDSDWESETPGFPLEHELALRLAKRSGSIRRVARMLWHMQEGIEETAVFIPFRPAHGPSLPVQSVNGSQGRRSHAQPSRLSSNVSASIIICSRNSKQLRKCLKALLPSLDSRHEIVVVAHQAGDGPALQQVAESHFARTVAYDGPFHFGIMNGLGVAASKGQAVCFLNDDVYPAAGDWLESMLAHVVRPDVGVAGALLLYPNGTIQHAGVVVGRWHFPAHLGRFRVESQYWPWLRMTREVTAVTGACMALRRSVWDELGGFDPRFPVNYNDIDLCLRAGERGYRILIETRAVLIHEECKTRIPNIRREESELLYERWASVISAPDKFFNPQLGNQSESIELPSPWTLVR